MATLLVTHPACLGHDPGRMHPGSPARLRAVLAALEAPEFSTWSVERRRWRRSSRSRGCMPGAMSSACCRRCRVRPCRDRRRHDHVAGFGRGRAARRRRGGRRGRCGRRRRGRQRVLRGAPARASCRPGAGDGVLPVQQRRDRRAAGARGARARAGRGRRFRRPSRQRHAGAVRGRRRACSMPRRTSPRSIPAPARPARPGSATSSTCRCGRCRARASSALAMTQRHPAGARRLPARTGADLGRVRRARSDPLAQLLLEEADYTWVTEKLIGDRRSPCRGPARLDARGRLRSAGARRQRRGACPRADVGVSDPAAELLQSATTWVCARVAG